MAVICYTVLLKQMLMLVSRRLPLLHILNCVREVCTQGFWKKYGCHPGEDWSASIDETWQPLDVVPGEQHHRRHHGSDSGHHGDPSHPILTVKGEELNNLNCAIKNIEVMRHFAAETSYFVCFLLQYWLYEDCSCPPFVRKHICASLFLRKGSKSEKKCKALLT